MSDAGVGNLIDEHRLPSTRLSAELADEGTARRIVGDGMIVHAEAAHRGAAGPSSEGTDRLENAPALLNGLAGQDVGLGWWLGVRRWADHRRPRETTWVGVGTMPMAPLGKGRRPQPWVLSSRFRFCPAAKSGSTQIFRLRMAFAYGSVAW